MFAQQPAPFKEPDRDVQSLLNLGHVRAEIEFLADVILCKQKMGVSNIQNKEFHGNCRRSKGCNLPSREKNERSICNLVFLSAADFQHVRAPHMIALTHTDPSSWHKKKKELKQFGLATKKTTQTVTCSSSRSRASSPVTAGQPDIPDATDNFSNANKLGQGAYGPVYKGKFVGDQEIAVKRLSRASRQGLQEFKNEVVLIAKLQHRNLVRLKGFCIEGEEKNLLYEYMPNQSLDFYIFDHTKSMVLNWEMRFNIILGIARGLLYHHQDSRLRIVHRDLKTSNILLDEEMNPKISDFGLARIVGGKETDGYMSSEYALGGTFSIKSYVYSFGVILLEIISGTENTGFYQSQQTFSLISYAWKLWTENKALELMDKTLDDSCNKSQFIKCVNCVNFGLLCVQEDPVERPAMSNVLTMLDSEIAISPTPKQPAFLLRRGNNSRTASSSTKPETIPEITTSLEEGR
ncbi:hypothetical protein PRUPE_3G226500 [Prunus persica]|uniref:non-specific serine/threonine protein kinase n=1 Tax=Prunus persica TaxID=3760 RepID=A0A251Q5D4_PRUPE|nr:hypothetical protein PRUPE_3G226500 [Prunus persica]